MITSNYREKDYFFLKLFIDKHISNKELTLINESNNIDSLDFLFKIFDEPRAEELKNLIIENYKESEELFFINST